MGQLVFNSSGKDKNTFRLTEAQLKSYRKLLLISSTLNVLFTMLIIWRLIK